jgi:hypothetical protein
MTLTPQAIVELCARKCDEMVDWPLEQHPAATITDNPSYLIGIRRGLVNATNAIRAIPQAEIEAAMPKQEAVGVYDGDKEIRRLSAALLPRAYGVRE